MSTIPIPSEELVKSKMGIARFVADYGNMLAESKLNRLELARLAGISRSTLSYLLRQPDTSATVSDLAAVAWACGYKLEIKLVKI